MTAEQRLELALRIIEAYSEDEGYIPRRAADDYEVLIDNCNLKATFIEHTLNESAGDYQTIQELRDSLKQSAESIKQAFYEGWASYASPCCPYTSDDEEWMQSEARQKYQVLLESINRD